jgi:hypothetical protein
LYNQRLKSGLPAVKLMTNFWFQLFPPELPGTMRRLVKVMPDILEVWMVWGW